MSEVTRARTFLSVEAATFLVASLVHAGYLIAGYAHGPARIAESVIAAVLVLGLVATWIFPAVWRRASQLAQGFALLGTLVGVVTIIAGIGPRTVADVVYHVVIIAVLIVGLTPSRRVVTG